MSDLEVVKSPFFEFYLPSRNFLSYKKDEENENNEIIQSCEHEDSHKEDVKKKVATKLDIKQ